MLSFHVKFVQTDRQMDRWTMVKQYAPDLLMQGHKKKKKKKENDDNKHFLHFFRCFLPLPEQISVLESRVLGPKFLRCTTSLWVLLLTFHPPPIPYAFVLYKILRFQTITKQSQF